MSVNGTNTVSTNPAIVYTSGSTGGERILPENNKRYSVRLQSYTTQAVYLKLGAAITSTTQACVILNPSTALNTINPNTIVSIEKWQGPIYALCCSSGAYLTILEVQADG